MKKLIMAVLALVMLLPCNAGAANENFDYPVIGNLYGLVDNGSRYESIFFTCIPNGEKIDCSFKSHCIRFPNKNKKNNQERYNKLSKNEKNDIRESWKKRCEYKKNLSQDQLSQIIHTEYGNEEVYIFDKMCKDNINVEQYIKDIDELENKICRVTTANWTCSFEKKSDGNWECLHIENMSLLPGIKKATVQTFYKDKDFPDRWDYTFEYAYIGKTKENDKIPENGKDSYSWMEGEPKKLPCEYVSLDYF